MVLAIDIDGSRTPGLPVEIGVLSHRALDDGVTHIESVDIVTSITQHDALEIGDTWSLIREELVLQTLGAKALVGIDSHRLSGPVSRLSTHHTGLANLVQNALLIGLVEQLEVDGATPVVLVCLAVILEDTFFRTIQIGVVGHDGDHGDGHLTIEHDIRLDGRAWGEPAVADEFGPNSVAVIYFYLFSVESTLLGWFTTIGGIINLCALRSILWERESELKSLRCSHHATSLAEDGLAKDMLLVADFATVRLARCRL